MKKTDQEDGIRQWYQMLLGIGKTSLSLPWSFASSDTYQSYGYINC